MLWLSNQGLTKLNESFGKFTTALVGVEGHGGALQEIRELRRRTQRLESIATVLLAQSSVKFPDLGE